MKPGKAGDKKINYVFFQTVSEDFGGQRHTERFVEWK
jgi:hypothetical protein